MPIRQIGQRLVIKVRREARFHCGGLSLADAKEQPCGHIAQHRIKRLAPTLIANAFAPDGLIEGVESGY